MIEILKTLIEKPEKIRIYIIEFLKFIISLIISSKMYVLIFGDYEPILIGDKLFWKDLYNFFSNGNILIVVFIFCFVKFVVLEMLSSLTFLVVNFIPKFISNKPEPFKDDSFFRFMLKQFGILVFDKEKNKMPTPGKNFYLVIDFLKGVNKHELRKEFIEIRNTNIFEIFNLYSVFSLLYYFILTDLHTPTINKLVVIGFVIVLYFLSKYMTKIDKFLY